MLLLLRKRCQSIACTIGEGARTRDGNPDATDVVHERGKRGLATSTTRVNGATIVTAWKMLLRRNNRNQLHATRDRTQSCRILPVDGPLDSPASPLYCNVILESPASPLKLSLSAAS